MTRTAPPTPADVFRAVAEAAAQMRAEGGPFIPTATLQARACEILYQTKEATNEPPR